MQIGFIANKVKIDNIEMGIGCIVEKDVEIGEGSVLGHYVVIHEGAKIGARVRIDDHAVIGKNPMRSVHSALKASDKLSPIQIGDDCIIGTSAVLYMGCRLGNRVLVADLATIRENVMVGDATIIGRGVHAYARIAIRRVAGYPGDIIQVPLVLEEDVNLTTSGATTISVQLRMNATLLDPIVSTQLNPPGATPRGFIVNNECIIDYELPIAETVNGVLANLRFKVMLGNDSVTTIALRNPRANNAGVLVESVDGEFTLLGTCLVGGARLLNPSGTARIVSLSPNPANNEIEIEIETIERGNTTISIADAMGRSVARVFEGDRLPGSHLFKFDASALGSGNYFVKLQTPTVVQTAILRIVK